ncbi:MAG: Uma2 family endonuclease [Trueperaceae bacterium]
MKYLFHLIDVIFHFEDVIISDIVFISNERKDLISKRDVKGAPDLVVEVISPSSVNRDLELCQREGVAVYIVVEPEEKRVHVWDENNAFMLGTGKTLACSVLPGFEIAVAKLFV